MTFSRSNVARLTNTDRMILRRLENSLAKVREETTVAGGAAKRIGQRRVAELEQMIADIQTHGTEDTGRQWDRDPSPGALPGGWKVLARRTQQIAARANAGLSLLAGYPATKSNAAKAAQLLEEATTLLERVAQVSINRPNASADSSSEA